MKMIDRNGRLFGKISVIDVLVILVVLVMAAALYFKNIQTHTGTAVTEQTITFQVRARGVDNFVADAIVVGDGLYDQSYSSGGRALGEITDVQVELIITVKGSGLITGKSYSINRVYDLGINSSRNYCTQRADFTGMVIAID